MSESRPALAHCPVCVRVILPAALPKPLNPPIISTNGPSRTAETERGGGRGLPALILKPSHPTNKQASGQAPPSDFYEWFQENRLSAIYF